MLQKTRLDVHLRRNVERCVSVKTVTLVPKAEDLAKLTKKQQKKSKEMYQAYGVTKVLQPVTGSKESVNHFKSQSTAKANSLFATQPETSFREARRPTAFAKAADEAAASIQMRKRFGKRSNSTEMRKESLQQFKNVSHSIYEDNYMTKGRRSSVGSNANESMQMPQGSVDELARTVFRKK